MLCACADRLSVSERERDGLFSCLYREHVIKYNHLFMRIEFLCQHFFTGFFLRVTSTQAALLTPGQREEGQRYSSGGKCVARSQFCQPFFGVVRTRVRHMCDFTCCFLTIYDVCLRKTEVFWLLGPSLGGFIFTVISLVLHADVRKWCLL